MKFMQIHTFYQAYLDSFYSARPSLQQEGYDAQMAALFEDGFSGSHIFAPYMKNLEYESMLVVANCPGSQRRWLAEHAPRLAQVPELSMHQIALAQVEAFRPDVLYLTDPITFDSRFVRALSYRPSLVFGWRAAGVPQDTDWSDFDLIVSNFRFGLELAVKHGARGTEFFMPGFPQHVAQRVAQEEKRHDVVFTGQVSAEHGGRRALLNRVSKQLLLDDRQFSLAYFIPGSMEHLEAGIAMRNHGAVWGMDMFRTLRRGRIALNAQIDMGNDQAGNLRLFETTGAGSFLLTDYHENISRYFEPGRELETYRNPGELMEKLHYYLENPGEREDIARRGQARCLNDYSMDQQAQELHRIVRQHLARKGVVTQAQAEPETAATLKEKAAAHLDNEQVKEAFLLLNRAKGLKTPLQGVDLLRAHCFLRMQEPGAALEALREELRHFPENREAAELAEALQRHLPTPGQQAPADLEPEFLELLQAIRPYTMLSEQRLYSLYRLARNVCERDLPGNFVECGVAAGGSSALLAFVIKRYSKQPRRLFSFDSFSGMPKPTELDSHQGIDAEATGWGTGTCAAPEQSVREICGKLGVSDLLTTVKGYFEETLPQLRDWVGMVAMLHLDGDWYSSTRAILDHLYDRLMPGAVLQVDDYGYWDGCRKAIHEFESERGLKLEIQPIDGTGVWFTRPDRFPVNTLIDQGLIADFNQDDPAPKGVASQMSINERFQLYHAVRKELPEQPGLLRFIEIGSYSGASLVLTHQALQRRGQHFQGICIEPGGTAQFHEVVQLLQDDVVHLPMLSHDAAKRLAAMLEPGRLPQFIFVDGDHTYAGVRQDILDFYPLLAPGGIMMFHDYLPELDDRNRPFILHHHGNAEPGIRRACQELMEETYRCERIDLPLLYPSDPTQTQPQLPIIPGVFSTVRAYRKPARQ